ncbi:hypothetical protein [Isoptericola dokdonensis]|uniref:Uncharacterized protein n=1 Tax=Isoptericola dokdonensis DS-3 TaxID=1300344 RepID=A0A168FDE1_9MICO|nr:hypothetical protein [Isoptericola dokdonensis]ANC31429.1 hypothetical protein I598_1881 [Isoptericola dokdonensis DS-3]
MSKPNNKRRRINMAQFKDQVSEQVVGEGSLIPVDLPNGETVWIKIAVNLEEDDDYADRLREAGENNDSEAMARVVLSGHPDHDADEQLLKWVDAGYTIGDLGQLVGAETNAARDRLAAFRYRG